MSRSLGRKHQIYFLLTSAYLCATFFPTVFANTHFDHCSTWQWFHTLILSRENWNTIQSFFYCGWLFLFSEQLGMLFCLDPQDLSGQDRWAEIWFNRLLLSFCVWYVRHSRFLKFCSSYLPSKEEWKCMVHLVLPVLYYHQVESQSYRSLVLEFSIDLHLILNILCQLLLHGSHPCESRLGSIVMPLLSSCLCVMMPGESPTQEALRISQEAVSHQNS